MKKRYDMLFLLFLFFLPVFLSIHLKIQKFVSLVYVEYNSSTGEGKKSLLAFLSQYRKYLKISNYASNSQLALRYLRNKFT